MNSSDGPVQAPVADSPAGAPDAVPYRMSNLGRHSLIYGIGVILTKAVSFVMLPIYTRFLTPADYGVLQLITMTLEVMSIFAGSRIAFGIYHYYHKASDETARRLVLSTAMILLAATYAAAAVAGLVFAPAIANVVFGAGGEYATYVRLAAAGMAFDSLIIVPMAVYQLRESSRRFVMVSFVRLCLQVVLNLVLLIPLDMGVSGVLLSNLLTSLLVGGVLVGQLISQIGARFRIAVAQEFLRFGLPLVVMQVATFVYTFGDRYFLNRAGGEASVGLYGLAYQFGFLVATLGFMPFQRVWDPQRFAVAKRPDRDAIFARVFILLNLGLITASLGIALFAGDVLHVIAAPEYWSAAAYVPLLAAAYVLHCWGNFLNLGIFIRERTEYFTLANWAAAIVALVLYVLLIPRWLAWGATFATLGSVTVRFWLAHVFSQRLWPVRYQWGPVVRLVVLGSAIGVVSALLPSLPLVASVGAHSLLFGAWLLIVWRFVLSPSERRMVAARVPFLRARSLPAS